MTPGATPHMAHRRPPGIGTAAGPDDLVSDVLDALVEGGPQARDRIDDRRVQLIRELRRRRLVVERADERAALLDAAIALRAEADLRWLDGCDELLTRTAVRPPDRPPSDPWRSPAP